MFDTQNPQTNTQEFIQHFIASNLTLYLSMRDPTNWFNKLFILPFCNPELTKKKIDLIHKLQHTVTMISFNENNIGRLFLLLFLFHKNTFKTASGNQFCGDNGDAGRAIEKCLINIIFLMEKNIAALEQHITQLRSEEAILPQEYKLDHWLEIKLKTEDFKAAQQSAIAFATTTHQKMFKPTNKHQTGNSSPQTPNSVSRLPTPVPSARVLQLPVS